MPSLSLKEYCREDFFNQNFGAGDLMCHVKRIHRLMALLHHSNNVKLRSISDQYMHSDGRFKKFREEIYPFCILLNHLNHGNNVIVNLKLDSSPGVDAEIVENDYSKTLVEIAVVRKQDKNRDLAFTQDGYVWPTNEYRREGKKVISKTECPIVVESHTSTIETCEEVIELYRKKFKKNYTKLSNRWLLIYCDRFIFIGYDDRKKRTVEGCFREIILPNSNFERVVICKQPRNFSYSSDQVIFDTARLP